MKRLAGLSTLAVVVSSLGGCGWLWGGDGYFRDRGSDYLAASQRPPMQIPQGVEVRPLEPLLPIPHQVADARSNGGRFEVPRPQRLQLADASDFSLETSDDDRWLVALRAPAQIWTATRQFLQDNGFRIAEEHPETGELITAWQPASELNPALRQVAPADRESRVRVRIEPGVQRNASEIHVLSAQRPVGSDEARSWAETAGHQGFDTAVLDELQVSLARSTDLGDSVSLLAERQFDAPSRVHMVSDASGNPLLQLDSDFDRAWSSIGRALQSADVRVDDLNRSLGVYYLNLAEGAEDPGARPGFFRRLLGGGRTEAEAERVQVRLVESAEGVQVSVQDDLDTLAPAEVSRRVLQLIQQNLG
ncbi:outer membrane protein assembly factor BamC [Stutzerimonas tarimensis]|uniref:Outer membrane protein assembly factor BamC n=1 Tax=Stutzerimonas tarimensis TaxID=1507735 RepID=A0ABV7T9D5_9GAMM